MLRNTRNPAFAARILFLCAMTPARAYTPAQASFLCGLPLPEAEQALLDLERNGLAVRRKGGAWGIAPETDASGLAEIAAGEDCTESALKYCLLLYEGRDLDAVEFLLAWTENRQSPRPAWALSFAAGEAMQTLQHASPHGRSKRELARFIELAIRVYSLADAQELAPRRMKTLLLKARGVAFMQNSAGSLYILDTILAVRKTLLCNADMEPFEEGRGRLRLPDGCGENSPPDEMRDDSRSLAAAMPYISMHNYLQGNARQTLDHFSLTSGQEQPVPAGADENSVPQGVFSSAFAALAAVQSGDSPLAVSILRTSLSGNAHSAGCAARSWLHAHLATVWLAAGRPDEALDHVDAALSIGVARNIQCWMAAYTALAHYHVLCGRPRAARRVLLAAVETAGKRNYRWGYNSPYFLDMLYVFRRSALPDLPGYDLEKEIASCVEGTNPLLRAVANRIRGDMLLRAGAPLREVQLPLLRSRAFFKIQQLPAEKCKTCAVLAQACLTAGERPQALRYAIEAWPCHEQFLPLGIYWSPELEKLLPAQRGAGIPSEDTGESWRQDFFRSLLTLNPESHESFPQEALRCVAAAFGASRVCLFDTDDDGRPRMTHALDMTREPATGRDKGLPLYLVKECLEGVPLRLTNPSGTGQAESRILCIPVPDGEGRFYALYAAGEKLSRAGEPDEPFLQLSGEYLGVLFRRRNEAAERVRETSRILAAQEEEGSARSLVYSSRAMRDVLEQADTAARSGASVLICGESGVGKELVARRIHEKSGRRGPFVAVNLSSLPEELFESEMQGYERGAFTGAFQRKIGLLEMADGGTLFIDEVPDISPRIQVKLLRLLQERNFMRLGSTQVLHSDFRLIVATNRNLFTEMRRGAFRSDLFYRICVIPLFSPPLRERPEDIDALIAHYLKEFSRGRTVPGIDPADALKLRAHAWPGNIRELRNVVERAVILAHDGRLNFSFDSGRFGAPSPEYAERADEETRTGESRETGSAERMMREMFSGLPSARDLEKQYITTILRMTGGKISGRDGAAALLGMSRSTLYDKMRALGIRSAGRAGKNVS